MTQEASAGAVAPAQAPAPTKPVAQAQPVDAPPALPAAPKEMPTIDGLPVPLPFPRPVELDAVEAKSGASTDALDALVAAATTAEPDKASEAMPLQQAIPPGGDYAVQFGASTVETEANSLMAKLKGPLADLLGDHPLSVVKGDSGGKTVFRVRALGYSRDEAAATCATAGAAGTKCFIAKN